MAVDHVKSTPITNLDATPIVANTTGEGAPGNSRYVEGFVTAIAASSVDATYRLVRVPSNAKVKTIQFESEAQGAGKFDLGVYYPTTGITGKPDLAANTINRNLFAGAVDCAAAVTPVDKNLMSFDKKNQPLWQAAGLTSDPGGFFDIVATVTTTAVTTGTGKVGVSVRYVI